jgi:hypothetical protein
MFLGLPFDHADVLQKTALILNTVVLIAALVTAELIYSEAPTDKRRDLRYFLPIIIVFAGLLLFALYKQGKVA